MRNILTYIFLIFATINLSYGQEDLDQYPTSLHIHSTVSNGKYTFEELALKAKEQGLKAIFITDHDIAKWNYGLVPGFRKSTGLTITEDSVLNVSPLKFMEMINDAQQKVPEVKIIPGLESSPYYYFEGHPFAQNLELKAWQRHMTIFGLNAEDMQDLPLQGNTRAESYSIAVLRYLIIPVMIFFAIYLYKKRIIHMKSRYYEVSATSKRRVFFAVLLLILAAYMTFMEFPYTDSVYDSFGSDEGSKPYQQLINYVNERGGLIFWAHPEANISNTHKYVKIETKPYSQLITETENYTGFASLFEGYKIVAKPGGIWDQTLIEYCSGKRSQPSWTIGEIDFHQENETNGKELSEVQTVFLVEPNDPNPDLLSLMKQGRYYATRIKKDYKLILKDFSIIDSNSKRYFSGDTIQTNGKLKLKANVDHDGTAPKNAQIRVIKNGSVIQQYDVALPFNFELPLDESSEKTYYRIDVESTYPHRIFSNPIFVEPEE